MICCSSKIAERGLDVNADQSPISGDRRWSTSGDRQRREPVVEVRLERDPTRPHVRTVLELGERVVERGLRVLPRAEAALTNLLAPAVAPTDVQHETPRAPASLDASRPAHSRVLRSRCWESAGAHSADVCARENGGSADVCAGGLCKRLRRRAWSPFGHGDHEYRRKTADDGERCATRKPLLSRRKHRFRPTSARATWPSHNPSVAGSIPARPTLSTKHGRHTGGFHDYPRTRAAIFRVESASYRSRGGSLSRRRPVARDGPRPKPGTTRE